MGRMPVPHRPKPFNGWGCPLPSAWGMTRRFHRLSAARGWVAYALRTRPPLSPPRRGDPARLACIRPAASVHPEPGSNSSLYYCLCFSSVPSHGLRIALSIPSRSATPDPPGPTRLPVLASSFQRTSPRTSNPSSSPLVLSGCKSTTFFLTHNDFSKIFFFNLNK